MANITIKNAIPYKTHTEVLNTLFGGNHKQHQRAEQKISKTKSVIFFNLAEADENGLWKPSKKKVNWLNIPAKDGSAFAQVELNKTGDEYFVNYKAPKDNAVFMWRKGKDGKYAYYFYGIFKWKSINKEIGLCVYNRTATTIDTAQWQIKAAPKTKTKTK